MARFQFSSAWMSFGSACLALTSAVLGPVAASSALEDCRGTAAHLRGSPAQWVLECVGDCTSPKKCQERSTSDLLGNFKHCGCDQSDVESCCNVILRSNNADPEVFSPSTKGDCPACSTNGVCTLVQISASQYQAACQI